MNAPSLSKARGNWHKRAARITCAASLSLAFTATGMWLRGTKTIDTFMYRNEEPDSVGWLAEVIGLDCGEGRIRLSRLSEVFPGTGLPATHSEPGTSVQKFYHYASPSIWYPEGMPLDQIPPALESNLSSRFDMGWTGFSTRPHRINLGIEWYCQHMELPGRRVNAWYVTVPFAVLVFAFLILPSCILITHLLRLTKQTNRASHGLCPHCGYDLRATPGRCPECGAGVAPAEKTPPPNSVAGSTRA